MTEPGGGTHRSANPGLIPRLFVAGLVLAIPLLAVGVGVGVALSAAHDGVRGGLIAALVTWGVTCAAAVGVVATFSWSVVGPARRLARGSEDVVAGGRGEALPDERSDEFGQVARAVRELARDREQLRGELRDSALRDPITGFYDGRELRRRLDQEEARAKRYDHAFALVVVEVDTRDGDVGGVSAAMKAAVRPTDIVARLDAATFAALLPETAAGGAEQVVDRLRSGLGPGLAAVGVADHPVAGATGEQVLRAALAALDTSRQGAGSPVTYGG